MAAFPGGVIFPEILAGPILQRVTRSAAVVFLVAQRRFDARNMKAEVWDPLPGMVAGFLPKPNPALELAGSLESPSDVEVRTPAPNIFVYRITLRAKSDWPMSRALAYRIAPRGTDWIPPQWDRPPLPGGRGPAQGTGLAPGASFPYPWFGFDPSERSWSVLSLPGTSPSTWIEADTCLGRLCRGSTKPVPTALNAPGPNVAPGRPTTALLLGADDIPHDEAAVRALEATLGLEFPSFAMAMRFFGYLLALSPALWQVVQQIRAAQPTATAPAPATAVSPKAAAALARIAAHVPLYGIPTKLFSITDTFDQVASVAAFATCFSWGNQSEALRPPDVGKPSGATAYLTGEPPFVRVSFSAPAHIEHPKHYASGPPRVFPFLVIASPTPVLPIALPPGFTAAKLGEIDNLFALGSDRVAYVNVPADQIDEKLSYSGPELARINAGPKAFTTLAAQRIYQICVCGEQGQNPPKASRSGVARDWNQQNLTYVDGSAAVAMLLAAPTFSILSSEASGLHLGYRMTLFANADHGCTTAITRVGHRVLPRSAVGVLIGNRLRRTSNQTDDNQLDGIELHIDRTKRDTTAANGSAPALTTYLQNLDGFHLLAIAGPQTQKGPPGPTTAANGRTRVWRQREFGIIVRDGRIIQVDDEQVISPGVRILVDPVYMRARSGFSVASPSAPPPLHPKTRGANVPVSMVIVHRTGLANVVHWVETYQTTYNQRRAAGETHLRAVTGTPYLLARDGTLIKQADDHEVVNHAGDSSWRIWDRKATTPAAQVVTSNHSAVGVELCKATDYKPYTEAQYASLLWLLYQYVKLAAPNDVSPLDIVGHGDVKGEGRDDPGMAFEWARLEAAGFGLRRSGAPLLTPLPTWPANIGPGHPGQQYIMPPGFAPSASADIAAYPQVYWAQKGQANPNQVVKAEVVRLVREIGYTQPIDDDALAAFRSHVFSGARRVFYGYDLEIGGPKYEYKEIEPSSFGHPPFDLLGLTAVWAYEVYQFVTAQRQNPTIPRAPTEPEAPR